MRKDEKSDESSEEEEGQAYYAGGSERTLVLYEQKHLPSGNTRLREIPVLSKGIR